MSKYVIKEKDREWYIHATTKGYKILTIKKDAALFSKEGADALIQKQFSNFENATFVAKEV